MYQIMFYVDGIEYGLTVVWMVMFSVEQITNRG